MGGDLAPNLGGTKKFFRGPISGKMSIFRVKISDDLFFSHRLGSSDFPFLFSHFPYAYYVKCCIMTISSQENHHFSLFILSRTSDNTASQNIGGGPMHGPPPPPQILGGPAPPSPPLGLRPWMCGRNEVRI